MHAPLWQRLLSYFYEQSLEVTASPHNEHLEVRLQNGRYQLCTANAIYSYGDLYSNYYRTFKRLDFAGLPGSDVLLLGLGLGSIPYMLERNFRQSLQYTAVEVDEAVAWLAHKYVLGSLASPVEVITADAALFVQQSERTFDLICMDVFQDDLVPERFEAVAFLEHVRGCLHPQGLLLYNRLAANAGDRLRTQTFYNGPFRQVFPRGGYLDVGSNWLLTNRPELLHGSRR